MACDLGRGLDGVALFDLSDLSPKQWASMLLISFRDHGLAGAVQVIRLAPPEIAVDLSAGLQDACLDILRPANDA